MGRTVINFSVKAHQRSEATASGNTAEQPVESGETNAPVATGGHSHNIPHASALPTPMSLMGSVQHRMQRQPSEREMQPSAEAQFEAQLSANPSNTQSTGRLPASQPAGLQQ